MNNKEINLKWKNISAFKNRKGYKALRVTSSCLPDLFVAIDGEGYRCLLLYLPKGVNIKTKEKNKSKLLLSFIPRQRVLLIKLKDFNFVDLFDDLILSIYSRINGIADSEKASEEFITTFYKWSDFFEDGYFSSLGEKQIQGLFGELFLLLRYVGESNPSSINSVLKAWKGPYDAVHDFEFESMNVEVKTKRENKPYVKISSEYQLEKIIDKGLDLLVVSVIFDLTEGVSIHDLINNIIEKTRSKMGDLGIIFHAMSQKGLTVDSTREYNDYRFIVKNVKSYDCTLSGFPKLAISNIPQEVNGLSYNLEVNTLSDYLIREERY